jgi:hypothetical protein
MVDYDGIWLLLQCGDAETGNPGGKFNGILIFKPLLGNHIKPTGRKFYMDMKKGRPAEANRPQIQWPGWARWD